jgi:D-methionine transport system ATP-binding protein
MINIVDLYKTYQLGNEAIHALDGVSLTVPRGEIFGVLGPSGAGKSTLIRCVNLLEKPTSGQIFVDGQELTALPLAELRAARRQIGMIFQHFNLLSSRTAAENIELPLEISGYGKAARQTRVKELLALVGLSDKAEAYPDQLSGGQKQRVGIARALASEPKVLLSDEATSALDPQTTLSILELLQDLNYRLKLTVLLITHEMNVIRQICDQVALIEDGRIVEQGRIDDLAMQPHSRISQALIPQVEADITRGASLMITFLGDAAGRPVLSGLIRKFDVEVNILAGTIQTIRRTRIGKLQIALTGAETAAAINYLKQQGLQVEHI